MRLEDVCSPGVRVADPDQALGEAAQVMLDSHVGALIVVEPDDAKRLPVGSLPIGTSCGDSWRMPRISSVSRWETS